MLECGLWIDIALPSRSIAIEVLGPCHFVFSASGVEGLDGTCQFKFRLLESLGWRVLQVACRSTSPSSPTVFDSLRFVSKSASLRAW